MTPLDAPKPERSPHLLSFSDGFPELPSLNLTADDTRRLVSRLLPQTTPQAEPMVLAEPQQPEQNEKSEPATVSELGLLLWKLGISASAANEIMRGCGNKTNTELERKILATRSKSDVPTTKEFKQMNTGLCALLKIMEEADVVIMPTIGNIQASIDNAKTLVDQCDEVARLFGLLEINLDGLKDKLKDAAGLGAKNERQNLLIQVVLLLKNKVINADIGESLSPAENDAPALQCAWELIQANGTTPYDWTVTHPILRAALGIHIFENQAKEIMPKIVALLREQRNGHVNENHKAVDDTIIDMDLNIDPAAYGLEQGVYNGAGSLESCLEGYEELQQALIPSIAATNFHPIDVSIKDLRSRALIRGLAFREVGAGMNYAISSTAVIRYIRTNDFKHIEVYYDRANGIQPIFTAKDKFPFPANLTIDVAEFGTANTRAVIRTYVHLGQMLFESLNADQNDNEISGKNLAFLIGTGIVKEDPAGSAKVSSELAAIKDGGGRVCSFRLDEFGQKGLGAMFGEAYQVQGGQIHVTFYGEVPTPDTKSTS